MSAARVVSRRAAKVSAMRWRRIGRCELGHVVERGRQPPIDQRPRARGEHQRLRGARSRPPGDQRRDLGIALARPGGAHEIENGVDDLLADRQAAHEPLRRHQLLGGERRLDLRDALAGGFQQDAPLAGAIGIIHVDLHQKAVELRLGQRIGAFLLQRILRRQHMERTRQVVAMAGDADMIFLHRLQQRRLRARRGAVDFVGHQQLGEHRPLDEAEGARLVLRLLQHFRAENIGRQQVGRELHAAGLQPEHAAERLDELGLGETRHADEQAVAAGEQRDERLFDHLVLAEDHAADGLAGAADFVERPLGGLDDGGLQRDGRRIVFGHANSG